MSKTPVSARIEQKILEDSKAVLKKWKEHYKQYEENKYGGSMTWIKDEHVEQHFDRWHRLQNITKCYWNEIELR